VQNLVLGAISGVVVILVILATVTILNRSGRITWLQVAVGIGIGLLGAFLVLISRTDLIPDVPEDGLERIAIITVTIVAVIGTWYRIVRA
jgi:zinc transporter ZupT